jgi:cyclophilin family peptidyl-prolyl cis-trans isomerase
MPQELISNPTDSSLALPNPPSHTRHARVEQGTFTAEIFMDTLPITASNFVDLCNTGFYNGVHFHRVIDGFMLQFGEDERRDGSPAATGTLLTGGPSTT